MALCTANNPELNNLKSLAGTLVGGTGGDKYVWTQDIGVTLKKIKVALGKNTVNALHVMLSNNKEKHYGTDRGAPFQEFVFHVGDCFRSLTLWPNKDGDRLGGLQFEVMKTF